MKKGSFIIGSWLALAAALLTWVGVVFFALQIIEMQNERAAYVSLMTEANLQEGQAAQLHALARETADDRQALTRISSVNVLAAVNLIESVRSGSAKVSVTGAQPEKSIPARGDAPPINVISLFLHTEGSFSDTMRILQLIESLPLATTVQSVNIARPAVDTSPTSAAAKWSLDARLRFFTTSQLPS
jgi:hypothetical protein